VYDILAELARDRPLDGNAGGSYLTMKSKDGGIFFVINIIGKLKQRVCHVVLTQYKGNFGTVFCDNAYYNKAIAASPVHALPGYIMGGLAWFVSTPGTVFEDK
jgi:Na+/proline symporter